MTEKPFILSGYGLSTIAKPLFAFATSGFFVLTIRVFERIGKGIRNAPRDAIIAESTDESVRGKAYGFHRAMDGIGSIFGAIIALILLPILGFRNIFLFAFIPGVIAVFLVLFIKEKNRQKMHDNRQDIAGFEKYGFFGEDEAFFDAVRHGQKLEPDIQESLQTVEIMECIRTKQKEYHSYSLQYLIHQH